MKININAIIVKPMTTCNIVRNNYKGNPVEVFADLIR